MTTPNYRTLNTDLYDPDSPLNFPLSTLLPTPSPQAPTVTDPTAAAQANTHIRTLLRSGDAAAALTTALAAAPLDPEADPHLKQMHLATVLEVLQGIRQADAGRVLGEVMQGPGGGALADTLMKYIYKGMGTGSGSGTKGGGGGVSPQSTGKSGFSQMQGRNLGDSTGGGSGQAMSVLLSWHEKVVEAVGVGGIVRVMSDRRTV